jgi:catechol 2,3-dioxygenase-like lactoylglutathione lyase family enzyme
MIDHVSIAVSDLERSKRFYSKLLEPLGLTLLAEKPGTFGFGKKYPEFWINLRSDLPPVEADSGTHICLRAPGIEAVKAFFATATEAGGSAEEEPQSWPQYHARYFAAFVRDPDGNRIEAVHFVAPDAEDGEPAD